jgi:periplasmic divalent cation tolerance protein
LSAILIQTTAPTHDLANRIADALVGEGLAACVQLDTIHSWYRWKGRVERADEVRLQIKTAVQRFDAVAARIRALHSYDVPEIIAMPIVNGAADYLAWIETESRS